MLKHFIYSSFSKSTTSLLCSLYYRYSSKLSSFFCILSFLVIAISIDQTFYSATHYLAAVWLDSRHDLNMSLLISIKWACIFLHVHQVFCILLLIQLHSVTWFYNLFKWTCNKIIYISTFSISMFTFLKMLVTWCNAWF